MGRLGSRLKHSYYSYVKHVKIADLKNNLSRHLAHVRSGGELAVFDRDTPVARIVPFGPRETARGRRADKDDYWTEDRLAELERQGVIRRGDPGGTANWIASHRPVKLPRGSPSLVQTLLRMRRESTR